jgi:hypothetical protein
LPVMGLLPKNHLSKRGLFAYLIPPSALAENLRAIRRCDRRAERPGSAGRREATAS